MATVADRRYRGLDLRGSNLNGSRYSGGLVIKKHSTFWYLVSLTAGVLFCAVLLRDLSAPWVFNDDYNGAFWSQAAHNFFRAGWLSTAGVPAPLYFGQLPIPPEELYVHHPTLWPALFTLATRFLGESESAARLVPITLTLLSAAGLWLLVHRTLGLRCAALTLLMFAALPMQLHYGRMVNFEALELTLIVGAALCFERWRATDQRAWAGAFSFCLLLSMLTDWLGFLLTLILAAKLFLEPKQRKVSLALLGLMTAAGILFLIQIRLANPDAWAELARAFQMRLGNGAVKTAAVTWPLWARTVSSYLVVFYLPVSWVLAFGGVALCFWRRLKLSSGELRLLEIAGGLFLMNFFYMVGLRNQSYVHDFSSFYLSVPLAIMAGFALNWIIETFSIGRGMVTSLATPAILILAGGLMATSIHSLKTIDSPFGILDDADDEPIELMTSLGKVIQKKFAPGRPIICNFDESNSPLAFYSQHPLITGIHSEQEWEDAVADEPDLAGEVIWLNGPEAERIISKLPPGKRSEIRIDGVPFCFWTPAHAKSEHKNS